MWPDLSRNAALITGGTRGLGLAMAQALGRHGAQTWLTHRWGSADEGEVARSFASNARPPRIVQADVASDADTDRLLCEMGAAHDGVDILISNVCVTRRGGSLDELRLRDFLRTLDYGAWPLIQYLDRIEARFGRLPRCVIATSSDGVSNHYPDYDYVAFAKSALEALAQTLARRTEGTATRVFILRLRHTMTEGLSEVFPEGARQLLHRFASFALDPEDAGNAVIALASGLLDGLHGQTLSLDRGAACMDNTMTIAPLLLDAGGNADHVAERRA